MLLEMPAYGSRGTALHRLVAENHVRHERHVAGQYLSQRLVAMCAAYTGSDPAAGDWRIQSGAWCDPPTVSGRAVVQHGHVSKDGAVRDGAVLV